MKNIQELKERLEEVAGKWNGDESGLEEDNALMAIELINHLDAIQNIVDKTGLAFAGINDGEIEWLGTDKEFDNLDDEDLLGDKLNMEYQDNMRDDLIDLGEMDENSGD